MTAYNTPIPNEFDDENDFWCHELCKMYESNRLGVVRNIKTKHVVGNKRKDGYYQFSCRCCSEKGKTKNYLVHRFIYECYFGLIKDDKVVDHINNIKTDNRLENLQQITQSENTKKDYGKGRRLPAIRVKATNIETNETFIYKSIYGASKDLHINNRSISHVLSGQQNTAYSKKYDEYFTFEKLGKPFKYIDIQKIKIKINIVKSNNVNLKIDDKDLLCPTEKDDR